MSEQSDCIDDLEKLLFSAGPLSPYVDASGRPSSGIVAGGLSWLGDYDLCDKLPDSRYCTAVLETIIQQKPQNATNATVTWGLCAPSSCNESQLLYHMPAVVNGTLRLPWLTVQEAAVHCGTAVGFSDVFIATVSVLGVIFVLCLLGTALQCRYVHTARMMYKMVYGIDEEGPLVVSRSGERTPLLNSREGPDDDIGNKVPDIKLLENAFRYKPENKQGFDEPKKEADQEMGHMTSLGDHVICTSGHVTVPCLDAIRVLSMVWIVLGQTYISLYQAQSIENPRALAERSETVAGMLVSSTFTAVDSFLFISGVLASLSCCKHADKTNSISHYVWTYLNRYLRLVPVMGVMMMLWIGVVPHLSSGPLSYALKADDVQCQKYWWTNLLLIQNIYPSSQTNRCMQWLWFVALDMQLFLLTPPIVQMLNSCRWRKHGVTLVLALIALSVIISATLITVYDINVNLAQLLIKEDTEGVDLYLAVVAQKPYCRLAAYLLGVLLASWMMNATPTQSRSRVCHLIGWLLCLAAVSAVVFGLYPAFHGHVMTKWASVLYGSLSGIVWGLALFWIVRSCILGSAGPVGVLLSWRGWASLSQLTYGVYLCHPIVIATILHNLHSTLYIDNMTLLVFFVGFLLVSTCMALLIYLFIELPVNNLKQYFTKGTVC